MNPHLDQPLTLFLSHRNVVVLTFVVPAVLACAGCNEERRGPERVPTFPITGVVHVDGKPQSNLLVKSIPAEDAQNAAAVTSSAYTDDKGRFEIGTYESGDGAPVGEYRLTFMWGQRNLMNGRYSGPDKLGDRYSDPKKSEIKVHVNEGEPNELGVIELKTP